jgi:hypothetical protein
MLFPFPSRLYESSDTSIMTCAQSFPCRYERLQMLPALIIPTQQHLLLFINLSKETDGFLCVCSSLRGRLNKSNYWKFSCHVPDFESPKKTANSFHETALLGEANAIFRCLRVQKNRKQ